MEKTITTTTTRTMVIIVGAGPAGLATAACLMKLSIPYIILEKEDCLASLWRKRSYDCLHLHLAKEFCALPHMPYPPSTPTYIPKDAFIRYLDHYATTFGISPRYYKAVESAFYDKEADRWVVVARDVESQEVEMYEAPFLVGATGDNTEGYIPIIPGIERFQGGVAHSSEYKNGAKYCGKDVLVVGCGNSGMEIAYDLSVHGAHSSIVVKNPVQICTREMVHVGMVLLKYLPQYLVDIAICWCSKLKYGNLSKYGLIPPVEGPFYLKALTGRSPVLDVGTVGKIKAGEIKVVPGISAIKEHSVVFENGHEQPFDAIVFATGYKSTALKWLKLGNKDVEEGKMVKWKGDQKGLYMAGFSKKGLFGIKMDAEAIADDIERAIIDQDLFY